MNENPRSDASRTLRGHSSELTQIHECLRNARGGRGAVVLIEGQRGFGKSRLLCEAIDAADAAGYRNGLGAAVFGDESLSLGVLKSALCHGANPVLDAAVIGNRESPTDPAYLLHQIESALREVAHEGPVLICVDDAQWADGATLAALRVLPHGLRDLPIVWMIAYRSLDASRQLLDLVVQLNGLGAETLLLRPLDATSIAQLVGDVVRGVAEPELLDLAARAGGSPGLVVELVQGLVDEGHIHVEGRRATLTEARIPERVCAAVRDDLARLSTAARHAVGVAAILGSMTSFDRVAGMLDISAASLLGPVEELVRAEFLTETGNQLGFRNELVREAVVETLLPPARHALRRQAIAVLLDAGESPLEPALSLASSAEPGDRAAISTLVAASRALGSFDAQAAAAISRSAFDLTGPAADLRMGMIADTILLLHAAGRADEGKQLADDALRNSPPPGTESDILLSVARMTALAPAVRTEAGRAALARPGLSLTLRAHHLAEHAANVLTEGRREDARMMMDSVAAAVADTGDASANAALDGARAQLAYMDGRYEETLRLLDTSAATGDVEEQTRLFGLLQGESLAATDELDAADRLAGERMAAAARQGRSWSATAWQRLRGRALLQMGRVVDAGATLDPVFEPTDAHDVVTVSDAATMAALGRVALHVGDGRSARRMSTLAEGILADGAPESRRHAAWLLARYAIAADDATSARAFLTRVGDDRVGAGLPMLMVDTVEVTTAARIARAAGDDELARAAVNAADEMRRVNPSVVSIAGAAAQTRGLLERDTAALAEAVQAFEASPRALAYASALEDYGVELNRSGERDHGVEVLGRALQQYSSCHAAWDASRVRRRLRELGVRRRIVKAARPTTGWAGLTDAEVSVVRLVAQGLTNRKVAEQLYVSPHTVSMHLRHVFTKLDINSRVELTRHALEYDEAA